VERSGLDDDDASPVKGFEEKKEADAGAVPGRSIAVLGRPRLRVQVSMEREISEFLFLLLEILQTLLLLLKMKMVYG
jgi:hypothetical protein